MYRMLLFCCVSAFLGTPFAQKTHDAYAREDVEALRQLLSEADTRSDSLLVRYRLYPITEDGSILTNVPSSLPDGSTRELALLSGLWAYRAGEASLFRAIQYGRRSMDFLDAAKERDDDNPFVLLVEGQSYLFRPSFAGADPHEAASCFHRLLAQTTTNSAAGISQNEARSWLWLALREAGRPDHAAMVRSQLTNQRLPPLYQTFIEDPPKV